MNKSVFQILCILLFFFPTFGMAQPLDPEHQIVFQISTAEKGIQGRALSNIINLQKAYGVDSIEIQVMALGPGVRMLVEGHELQPRIEALQMVDVVFNICGNTLDTIARTSGESLKIIEDVNVVHYGFEHIIQLQEAGYTYLVP